VFDESGAVLALRSDMTVPIARVVATRYGSSEPPLRFCYFAHCYRGVRPQRGQPRELLQAGIELIGSPAPEGTAETLTVLCHSLDAVGLKDYRVGVGDASLFPALMASLAVPQEARAVLLDALVLRDFVGLEQALEDSGLSAEATGLLLDVPQRRGGPEVLADLPAPAQDAVTGLRRVRDLLEPAVAERVIVPWPRAQHRLLHGRRVRRLRPGPRRPDRRGRTLRRAARALRSLAAGCRLRARRRPPAHSPRRRGARHGGSART
jgi:ATP phosphoribosyltransferase regulatory subunit